MKINHNIVNFFALLVFIFITSTCSSKDEGDPITPTTIGPGTLTFDKTTFDFGERYPVPTDFKLLPFTITNGSDQDVRITEVEFMGMHSGAFGIHLVKRLKGKTISAGTNEMFQFLFNPPSIIEPQQIRVTCIIREMGGKTFELTLTASTRAGLPEGIVYVKHDATGANNGMNWQNAFTDLNNVLLDIGKGKTTDKQIWVAAGTYNAPMGGLYIRYANKFYGGFNGTESSLDQRNWVTNRTILSGNNESYHVLLIEPFPVNLQIRDRKDLIIDGFDIVKGAALDPLNNNHRGGGIFTGDLRRTTTSLTTVKISNCRIIDNKSATEGAAIYANHSPSIFVNCLIARNTGGANAGTRQGEIDRLFGGGQASIIYSNPNRVGSRGEINFINCTITGNIKGAEDLQGITRNSITVNEKVVFKNSIMYGSFENIVYRGVRAPIDAGDKIKNCIINMGEVQVPGPSNFFNNPDFIDIVNLDVNVNAGSDAINNGDNSDFPAEITKDLDYNARIIGSAIDIGAIEKQ